VLHSASRYSLHPVTLCIPLLSAFRYSLHPVTFCIPLLSASRYFLHPVTLCIPLLSASRYSLHPVTLCIPLLSASRYFMPVCLNIFDSAVFLPLVWETKFHIPESTEIYPQLSGLTLHCAEVRRSCLHHCHCAKTSSTSTS
jgi:hypothetical protein